MRAATFSTIVLLGAATPAAADEIAVSFELPRHDIAEYHKPYVAIWVERADRSVAATLAVWYDTRLKEREGEKWLKDLRQWWRRAGRDLALPIDGVSGATRAPGKQTLSFTPGKGPLPALEPGAYTLIVEAARESGGRESVELPFTWPDEAGAPVQARGASEIGAVDLQVVR